MGKFFPFTTWGSFPYNTVNEGRADIMNKQEIYAFLKEKNLDFEILSLIHISEPTRP